VFKSLPLLSFLFVLTLLVLAPPSILTINNNCHTSIGVSNEEEGESNQEKDIEDIDVEESEDENKEHFFSNLTGFNNSTTIDNTLDSIFLIEGISAYFLDIQLPPPEYLT